MKLRSVSIFLPVALLIILALVISPRLANVQPAAAQSAAGSGSDPLAMLAAARGYSTQQLDLQTIETLILIDGTQITLVKALDRQTDATLSAAFKGQQLVDARLEQQLALEAWRRAHGALSPELLQKLESATASEKFTVAVWLKGEIEALPRPDFARPAGESLSGSSAFSETGTSAPLREGIQEKSPSVPVPADQVPLEVRQQAYNPLTGAPSQDGEPSAEIDKSLPQALNTDQALLAQVETFKQQNEAHLRQQVSPLRTSFLEYSASRQLQVQYASEIAPLVVLTALDRDQLAELARLPEVDMLYDASLPGGALLDIARPTQNADLLELWGGYTGAGVNVAIVEGERATNVNPNLTLIQTRDTNYSVRSHPTAVAGMVASFHASIRGIARGANIYSANGDNYATIAALQAAMDWASARVSIMNNSFWAADCGLNSSLYTIDRHMDYLVRYNYDLSVVASGNFATVSCDNVNPAPWVSSPAKGYNVLAVGNYQDQNTLNWTDDTMRPSSSYNSSGRWKPEVAASGSSINSTTLSSPWTGDTGSGTSYASPMVAGLAANIMQAAPGLSNQPEAVSAIIMATALHNIEGSSALSWKDGTGGMVASAALASVERGHYDDVYISSSTVFPMTYNVFAYKGETVRLAIRWLSNPSGDYASDVLPVDLDLKAYRADNTTLLTSSSNGITNLEIVEFVAPASETFKIRIERFGGWIGGATWLGVGWWRGTYRIAPDVGYSDPKATPLGTHLSVFPTDYSPTNYWRAVGIRSVDSDHDLKFFTRSIFDNPGLRTQLKSSLALGGTPDFILVDGNHWSSANQEQYVVDHWSGTGGYTLNRSNLGQNLSGYGWYGPFTMASAEVVKVFDVWFGAGVSKQIQIVPTGSNAADLGAALFKSDGGNSSTWYKNRYEFSALSNASSANAYTERFYYTHTAATSDYLGLVVFKDTVGTGQFYIYVTNATFVPLLRK